MNAHSLLLISSFIYLISLVNFSSTECIPVYMWGNIQYNEPISPLQVTDREWFMKFLENRLDKKSPVVVFAEQSLSPEDFLLRNEKDQSIFSTLPPLQESSTVNYWPCVKNPIDAVDKLTGRNVVLTSLSKFSNESIKLEPRDVLIIDLNDADEDEGRISMLQRHDESFGKIYENLQKQYDGVTMLFTAYQPSWITVNEVRSHRRIRDTSKAEGDAPSAPKLEYVQFSTKELLISALDSPVLYSNGAKVDLKDASLVSDNITDNGFQATMTLKDIPITIKWDFKIGGGYWTLFNLSVTNSSAAEGGSEYYFRVKELYAPHRFSYHCANKTFVNPSNSLQYITLDHFQLQVFFDGDNGTKFGDAYDCTGFMSTAIWSGLFVTFILVLIMTCGLTMMMDIKTMDRFDDPKGKTITINASE